MLNNLPDKWDMETDFVAIGSGIGGLSAAITAHENGAKALILERSAQVGGVTALSQGRSGSQAIIMRWISESMTRRKAVSDTCSASRWAMARMRQSSISRYTRGRLSNTSRRGPACG